MYFAFCSIAPKPDLLAAEKKFFPLKPEEKGKSDFFNPPFPKQSFLFFLLSFLLIYFF
jgi:hypothetical protein